VGLHVKCPVLLSDFNPNGISPKFLVRISHVKFENNLQGLSADSISQTDRHVLQRPEKRSFLFCKAQRSTCPCAYLKSHDMKMYGRLEIIGPRPDRVTPSDRVSGTHWAVHWVGFGAGTDYLERRKNDCLYQESNTVSSVVQLVA
jgi:hypothetical protein